MKKISNVELRIFRKFLQSQGCIEKPCKGGHEKWVKPGITRSVILQSHADPVPKHIIESNLRTLGVSKEQFIKYLEEQ